jgi:acetyl esterase
MRIDFGNLLREGVGRLAQRLRTTDPATLAMVLGKAPRNDRGVVLDPQAHLIVKLAGLVRADPDTTPIARRRARMSQLSRLAAGPSPACDTRDLVVPGGAPLRARLYRGVAGTAPLPACVYFHGGGFVEGDLDTHDVLCRRLAKESGCAVLSVEYRKAPEHRFPLAIEDARRAFAWARAEAASLGLDPARLGVGGDSAGGNLAAAVGRLDAPAFQLLIYPALDMTRASYSQRHFARGFFLDGETIAFFVDTWLGPAEPNHPLASPVFAPNLAAAARAHVVTAGFDPLRDEGEGYAALLEHAGVEVTLHTEETLIHGFANMTGLIAEAERAVSRMAQRLAELAA